MDSKVVPHITLTMIVPSAVTLLVLLVGLSQGHVLDSGARIVNGTEAVEGEFPYMVSLQLDSFHFCGATILDENHILTAAHCLNWVNASEGMGEGRVFIRAGSTLYVEGGQRYFVVSAVLHEDYLEELPSFPNDIAIAKVRPAIVFNEKVQPVTLVDLGVETDAGLDAVAMGWGLPRSNATGPTDHLMKVDLKTYSDEECADLYNNGGPTELHICAGVATGGYGVCNTDSGGPLMVDGIQVGVLSFGNGPCGGTIPDAWTQISYYRNWIQDNIRSDKL